MKPLSASIIVLSAAILIASGGHIRHHDTSVAVMALGCLIGLGGLISWLVSFQEK
jgi:hypothetical protein